jgi:hypothetical protein
LLFTQYTYCVGDYFKEDETGHAACMWNRNIYVAFVKIPEEKRPHGKPGIGSRMTLKCIS